MANRNIADITREEVNLLSNAVEEAWKFISTENKQGLTNKQAVSESLNRAGYCGQYVEAVGRLVLEFGFDLVSWYVLPYVRLI